MFWHLGLKLARRTFSRNVLAVISLAVATLTLPSAWRSMWCWQRHSPRQPWGLAAAC